MFYREKGRRKTGTIHHGAVVRSAMTGGMKIQDGEEEDKGRTYSSEGLDPLKQRLM